MKSRKVSLSRNGFDSGFGGMASPILPDGTLLSLPIPDEYGTATYEDLSFGDKTYLEIIEELRPDIAKDLKGRGCHVDLDLRCAYIDEEIVSGWKPAFGQRDAALKHLQSFDFGVGDVFLFYGWFKKTRYDENGRLRFLDRSEGDTPNRHVIFGYMEVGEVLTDKERIRAEYRHHPHACDEFAKKTRNALFLPTKTFSLDGSFGGCGTLNYSEDRQLTARGENRSVWKLPDFFAARRSATTRAQTTVSQMTASASRPRDEARSSLFERTGKKSLRTGCRGSSPGSVRLIRDNA